jgi:Proteasomal ATPase OB C-terminal domain
MSSRYVHILVSDLLNIKRASKILNVDPEGQEDGANQDLDSMRKGKTAVIKTSTRQTVFLPLIGLVPPEKLEPQDLIGVNKDSYLVLDTLPAEYDSRVKAMEVDERPTETYTDIGGLEKQIEELVEAIVLPMEQADKFRTLGIKPPKGCLMYGPPGEHYLHATSSLGAQPTKELERPSLLVHVPHRQMPATSNWPVPRWCKCSLVMVLSSSATPSSLRKRRRQPSSLLMSWMQ